MTSLTPSHFLVDNSKLELITTCPQLAYLSIIRSLRPSGESPALRYGGFIHRALAYRYRRIGQGHEWSEDVQIRILQHAFTKAPCDIEGWRNLDSAVKTIRAYNAAWIADSVVVAKRSNGLPLVEQPFAVDTGVTLHGRRIVYIGRIDLVLDTSNGLLVVDHKTTSLLGDSFWLDQAVSPQHRGYCWALKETLGQRPMGYEVNAVATRESIVNFDFDPITGRLITTGKSKAVPCEFARSPLTTVSDGQLHEWYDNMLCIVDNFLSYVDRGIYPSHKKHCVHKYGICPFYHVCNSSLSFDDREAALQSSAFVENTWSPLYK
jgi:hypothetical protein